ncbi:hypothetical protein [Desulfofustis glycolicus]|uniref:Uncharacterized protein n=1 Tax=Desulfofustis glycolicus DSM 9705 TaxID=1121409 RepID=A0A1M5SFE1_9BACT|nr:hypothetical protein [Desulfofustis glycolicus]MCB2216109.1 hypothetical protein [Desulfobulbaceae bacterium]SHH37317.1 hypothetical protein SAMN02745124_00325 [Desulfofustis glycolicus DSM 9705]
MGWYTDYDDGTRDSCGLTREQREAQEEMQREHLVELQIEQSERLVHGDSGSSDNDDW